MSAEMAIEQNNIHLPSVVFRRTRLTVEKKNNIIPIIYFLSNYSKLYINI